MGTPSTAKRLFYVAAPEDEGFRKAFEAHLVPLERIGAVICEGPHRLLGGEELTSLDEKLGHADVVVLLLSPSFLAADDCHSFLGKAAARKDALVTALVRACQWNLSPLGGATVLSPDGKSIAESPHPDRAWLEVMDAIRAHLGLPPDPTRTDVIDFTDERSRHTAFFGRADVLTAIDDFLLRGDTPSGWILVQGGPGFGKSALLSQWLARYPETPHHFIRRGYQQWDQPSAIIRSLAARIEARYPAQRDPDPRPDRRLDPLLRRVSSEVLVPRCERLVLVIDGLDEAARMGSDSPLGEFLPLALPPGVFLLCASRPDYPQLSAMSSPSRSVSAVFFNSSGTDCASSLMPGELSRSTALACSAPPRLRFP